MGTKNSDIMKASEHSSNRKPSEAHVERLNSSSKRRMEGNQSTDIPRPK